MDPITVIGLVSSIAQLADASFKIIGLLDTIKEGGRERRKLCDEITLLWMTLRNLETQFVPLSQEQNGFWMRPIDSLAEPGGVFDQLSKALDEVWEKLTTSDSMRGKVMQSLRWPLDQAYVERTVARIEHLKTSIIIVEGQASIALAQEMREDVSAVRKTISESAFREIIDWVSPLNFREKQDNITPTPGTGGWFFNSEEFKAWESGEDRWLWCYGTPGAGKSYIAASAVSELRRLHESDGTLVLVAFCSYDTADSQSVDNLIASLLKQVVQIVSALPSTLQNLFHKHVNRGSRPKLSEFCDILGDAILRSRQTYIVLDALDEIADESKRIALLDTLYNLTGKPKVMVTSRKIENIANRFGFPLDGNHCSGCERKRLEYYYHCEDCVGFDHCEDCKEEGERKGHVFVKQYSSIKKRIAAQPEDLESYVNRRIEIEEDLRQIVERHPDLKPRILETVVETAQDMFLLARFHMDSLADCLTFGELENALNNLPQAINDTYDQAMIRIEKLSANRRRAVKRLLLWLSHAERPLTIKELEHATAVSRGVREINEEHIVSSKVLTSLSAGLVIIDENERVRLTHKTAEDYFSKHRTDLFTGGDIEIAECCLAYLRLSVFESGPCSGPDESKMFEARLKKYPFFGYAAQHWGDHARRCESEIVTPQALIFLRSNTLLEASVQALWYTDTNSENSWDVRGGVDALHLASFFGLNDVVVRLLSEGSDPNLLDSMGTTALIYACTKGHLTVVKTLLDAGARADTVDNRGSTALHKAVKDEYLQITQRLTQEMDIAINAFFTSFNNYTALTIACWCGNVEIVRALLSRSDIDVNLEFPTSSWNPLHMSADENQIECVEALLQHPSINKDYRDDEGNSAVHYAARSGSIGCLKALLGAGADPNLPDCKGGRPIHRAIDCCQFDTVKLLLQNNVECNYKDVLGRTLVHAASINGHSHILRLLLESRSDVDVNTRADNGETALHDAARLGALGIVRVLIEFGARTDIESNSGKTPVRVAKDAGKTLALEILHGAREKEIEADKQRDAHSFRRANTFAVKTERSIFSLVLEEDVERLRTRLAAATSEDLKDHDSQFNQTALHLASERASVEIVNMLLEAGAPIDPMDDFYRTPLIMACQRGDADIVRSLVKYGADVNHLKFYDTPPWELALNGGGHKAAVFLLAQPETTIGGATSQQLAKALGWAAALGDINACKRLVEAGAPINLKNDSGMTPVQLAKSWEHDEVEAFLFEAISKSKAAVSSKAPALDSVADDKKMEDTIGGVGHPPRRAPTSKKEFMELIGHEPKNHQSEPKAAVTADTNPASEEIHRSPAKPLSSRLALAILIAILAVLLSFALPSMRAFVVHIRGR